MVERTVWIPSVVAALMLSIGVFILETYNSLEEKKQQLLFSDIVVAQASSIERRLSRSISASYILESLVRRTPDILQNFNFYAKDIIQSLGGISNLQLAPKGIIEKIYPLEGQNKALGHNILLNDKRKSEAHLAIKSKQLTLAGPFELIQGGIAVIARNPVFLTDEENNEYFWGFTSVLIYLDDLLAVTDLEQLTSKGYRFQLSRQHPDMDKEDIFAGEPTPMVQPIQSRINIPNGFWTLRMSVPASINQFWHKILLFIVFILSALTGYTTYFLLKQPRLLQEQVKEKTLELEKLAFYDPLTSLYNRRRLIDFLKKMVKQAQRNESLVAILYIDLDQFKRINDTLGHSAGDYLLKQVAHRLLKVNRESDIIARLGGDEFCVLLSNMVKIEEVQPVVERIMTELKNPIHVENHEIIITPSIGITFAPLDSSDAGELLQYADLAMYEAKDKGRNNYKYFSNAMNQEVSKRLTLEQEMRQAIERNEFQLHYQPIFDVAEQRIRGVEALIRWQHPTRGLLMPNEFIGYTEDTGLIIPIGDWVLKCACQQIKVLNDLTSSNTEILMSVNLSPRQFLNPNLLAKLKTTLKNSNINPHWLILEITESSLMQDFELASAALSELRILGLRVAIDDFGTGYSSLYQLKRLPVDILKIDKAFIHDLDQDESSKNITATIITLAHLMGLKVVAEGIENAFQRDILQSLSCDYMQGYYYYKPMALEPLIDLVKKQEQQGNQ